MSDKETSLEFVERMERLLPTDIPHHQLQAEQDARQLLKLAKTAALIDTHAIVVQRNGGSWVAAVWKNFIHTKSLPADLHIAVRAVADKIKEAS